METSTPSPGGGVRHLLVDSPAPAAGCRPGHRAAAAGLPTTVRAMRIAGAPGLCHGRYGSGSPSHSRPRHSTHQRRPAAAPIAPRRSRRSGLLELGDPRPEAGHAAGSSHSSKRSTRLNRSDANRPRPAGSVLPPQIVEVFDQAEHALPRRRPRPARLTRHRAPTSCSLQTIDATRQAGRSGIPVLLGFCDEHRFERRDALCELVVQRLELHLQDRPRRVHPSAMRCRRVLRDLPKHRNGAGRRVDQQRDGASLRLPPGRIDLRAEVLVLHAAVNGGLADAG